MMTFLTTQKFDAVDDDPAVRSAADALQAACLNLERLEAEEARLIRVQTGLTNDIVSAEQLDEAHARLEVQKGTQSRFYLPAAQAERRHVQDLRQTLESARAVVLARLVSQGHARLKPFVERLCHTVAGAQKILEQIEQVRCALGEAGLGEVPENPCQSLLPGQIVDHQLRIACEQLGLERR